MISILGHGFEDHVRFPKMVEALLGKRIAHVAPGLSNMVVVTEDHQMIAWGANDYGQLGIFTNDISIKTIFVHKIIPKLESVIFQND